MLDKFRDLNDTGKMVVIGLVLSVFVVAVILVGSLVKQKEEVVVPDTGDLPYASSSPSATATPTTTPTATPSATATPTAAPTPGSDIVHGETNLSVEDQQTAQSIAKDGILNYFKTTKEETPDARNGRLGNYFAPESNVTSNESLNSYFGMEGTSADNYIISAGTIDYIDPVGGTSNLYKVVAGITYKVQFNRAGQTPQILEKNGVFTMLLSKDSGSWKIVSFDDALS